MQQGEACNTPSDCCDYIQQQASNPSCTPQQSSCGATCEGNVCCSALGSPCGSGSICCAPSTCNLQAGICEG
jgi:hypothetical protein